MRGHAALELVESVVTAVTPHLPPEVRCVRARLRGFGVRVWAVPASVDVLDDEYGFLDIQVDESGGSISSRGPESPFGIGTWIPLVPAHLRRRLEAADALGLVRDAVTRVVPGWPDPHATEKSRIDGGEVIVWFEDDAGRLTIPEMRLNRVP